MFVEPKKNIYLFYLGSFHLHRHFQHLNIYYDLFIQNTENECMSSYSTMMMGLHRENL